MNQSGGWALPAIALSLAGTSPGLGLLTVMSRAFTKEIDDAPEPPLPDRPVGAGPNLVTPRGAGRIEAEIERIDAELAAGTGNKAELLRDQRYWLARKATMQVVPPAHDANVVAFGTTVSIRRRNRKLDLTLVGEDEADPATRRIAWTSPLATALLGAEPGEMVFLETSGDPEPIEVLSVRPA